MPSGQQTGMPLHGFPFAKAFYEVAAGLPSSRCLPACLNRTHTPLGMAEPTVDMAAASRESSFPRYRGSWQSR